MSDKKSRTKLSIEDKMAMFTYKEEHPDASFASIAEIFTEKLRICDWMAEKMLLNL